MKLIIDYYTPLALLMTLSAASTASFLTMTVGTYLVVTFIRKKSNETDAGPGAKWKEE